jgi:hypothetical protein
MINMQSYGNYSNESVEWWEAEDEYLCDNSVEAFEWEEYENEEEE